MKGENKKQTGNTSASKSTGASKKRSDTQKNEKGMQAKSTKNARGNKMEK